MTAELLTLRADLAALAGAVGEAAGLGPGDVKRARAVIQEADAEGLAGCALALARDAELAPDPGDLVNRARMLEGKALELAAGRRAAS